MMVTHFLSVPGAWLYVTVILTVRAGPAASHCTVTTLPEVAHVPVTQPGVQPVCPTLSKRLLPPFRKLGEAEDPGLRPPGNPTDAEGPPLAPAQECV